MLEVKPPQSINHVNSPCVFLAGTIDNGASEDWQKNLSGCYRSRNVRVRVLNPRRDDWDSSWEQSIDNLEFYRQVNWELSAMEKADVIFFHFEPNSKSPITLMELGLHADSGKCVVSCPKEFWRCGNVEIVCERYGIPMFHDITSAYEYSLKLF